MGCTDGKLNLSKLGLGETSMRVRVGRNLASFPLPGAMTREDRVKMESTMITAFKKLMVDKNFGGSLPLDHLTKFQTTISKIGQGPHNVQGHR